MPRRPGSRASWSLSVLSRPSIACLADRRPIDGDEQSDRHDRITKRGNDLQSPGVLPPATDGHPRVAAHIENDPGKSVEDLIQRQ